MLLDSRDHSGRILFSVIFYNGEVWVKFRGLFIIETCAVKKSSWSSEEIFMRIRFPRSFISWQWLQQFSSLSRLCTASAGVDMKRKDSRLRRVT